MSKSKPSLPRGTRDFGPEVSAKRSYIIDKIKKNFIKYGFSQLETPAMENLTTLTGKYGDEGDQLLFKIIESGDYFEKAKSNIFVDAQLNKYSIQLVTAFNLSLNSIPNSNNKEIKLEFLLKGFQSTLKEIIEKYRDKNDKDVFNLIIEELSSDVFLFLVSLYDFKIDEPKKIEQLDEAVLRIQELLNVWFFKKIKSQNLTNYISSKGLRYDLTVPFARFVVMNQHEISFPFKRFQIQPVWRADRPQKGRYREFYQCDADIVGSKSIWNEAELTLLFNDVFNDLGLQDYIIKVNHREILFLLAKYVGLEGKEIPFCTEIDKLDKIGEEKVVENILAFNANEEKLKEVMSLLPISDQNSLIERIKSIDANNSGVRDVASYFETLDQFKDKNLKVELDLSLARGLSYYTGMIYEVKPTSVQMGSICGGGRYDNLTGVFGLEGISGIGISFGLDRIYDVMEELNLFPKEITQRLDVLILHFGEENLKHGQLILTKLRDADIKADLYPDTDKIKKQFNYADKIQTPYTLIIGDDEMKSGDYMLKNMQTGEQKPMNLDKIIQHFKG